MKRYFFDVTDGFHDQDEKGVELADDRAAQIEAIRFAGEVLRHEPDRLEDGRLSIQVFDAEHEPLFSITVTLS